MRERARVSKASGSDGGAKEVRALTLTALGAAGYVGASVGVTRDCDLVGSEGVIQLPLANASIPLGSAYLAMPIALFCLFIYLYENLDRAYKDALQRKRRPSDWPLSELRIPELGNGVGLAVLTQILVWGGWPLVSMVLAWRTLPFSDLRLGYSVCALGLAVIVSTRYWVVTARRGSSRRGVGWGAGAFVALLAVGALLRPGRSFTDFSGSKLVGLNFRALRVHGANFSGAMLGRVDLEGVDLGSASFASASLDRSTFGTDQDLTRVDFTDAKLARAFLAGARVTHLAGADLSSAYLRSAKLIGVSLQDAVLVQAKFGDVTSEGVAKLDNVSAEGADFFHAGLEGATFGFAKLRRANFTAARLKDAHFENADLTQARFAGANLEGAHFEAADLEGADLTRAFLQGASYDGLTRLPSNFSVDGAGMVRGDVEGEGGKGRRVGGKPEGVEEGLGPSGGRAAR